MKSGQCLKETLYRVETSRKKYYFDNEAEALEFTRAKAKTLKSNIACYLGETFLCEGLKSKYYGFIPREHLLGIYWNGKETGKYGGTAHA